MSANPLAPPWLTVPGDAGELIDTVWSANARRATSGAIEVAGIDVRALAGEFGTPLFVLDEDDVRGRADATRVAFDRELERIGSAATVYYAAKAFLCADLARWMVDAGVNIDVCTGGELAVALAAGVDPTRIGLHGNNKSAREIDRAIEAGVGVIVIDSLVEIDRVADSARRHGRSQRVRLRVNSGVHAHTHEYLATAREDQKFGISIPDVPAAVASIRGAGPLEFLGLHSHIGSQIFDTSGFAEAARRLLAVHARLLAEGEVPELNLGGGFGIAYTGVDEVMPIDRIAAEIADTVARECRLLGIPVPVIAVEPGRTIVGPSTMTVYEVGTVKPVVVASEPNAGADHAERETAMRTYLSVDGGMSDNIRTALYGATYTVSLAGRRSDADPMLVRVVGKHCESGDVVVRDSYLPGDVVPGDLLAVAATGAYCWSLASNYNYLGRPPVVAVASGTARILVRGETESDLLARDAGITPAARPTESGSTGSLQNGQA